MSLMFRHRVITTFEANDHRVDLFGLLKNSPPTTKRNNVNAGIKFAMGIAEHNLSVMPAAAAPPASHRGNSR